MSRGAGGQAGSSEPCLAVTLTGQLGQLGHGRERRSSLRNPSQAQPVPSRLLSNFLASSAFILGEIWVFSSSSRPTFV